MTIPNNLFIDTPDIEDTSMTRLNNDPSIWPEEVITKLKEKIPYTANLSLSVKFMHSNDESGSGTGSITATTGQKTCVVPLIIKDRSLYPLDIFLAEGKILPLNSESIIEFFNHDAKQEMGKLDEYPILSGVDRYLRGESLQSAIFPPNWGRYSFASVNEKYPILKDIVDTIDGSSVKEAFEKNPKILAHFYSTPHFELVTKLANTRPVNMGEFRQSVDNLVMRTVGILKKEAPNKYTLLSNATNVFSPAMNALDRAAARDFCSSAGYEPTSTLHDLDQNGEKTIFIEDNEGDHIFIARPEKKDIVEADTFGRYNVRTMSTGVNVEGFVIPVVIDFDQNVTQDKLFLGKTTSTIQPRIFGIRMDGQSDWKPKSCCPLVGQTGSFIYMGGEKSALATVPVTIKQVFRSCSEEGDSLEIKAIDLMGLELKMCVLKDSKIQRIVKTTRNHRDGSSEEVYLIPSDMAWFVIDGFETLSSSLVEYAVKTAAEKLTGNPIVLLDKRGSYEIRGLDKYAGFMDWDKRNLERSQALFLMASVGMGEEKIAEACKEASRKGKAEIHGINYPEILTEEKVAAIHKTPHLDEFIETYVKSDFLKVSSYIENAQTVDALLSLNFVNSDNIAKFIKKIPLLKAAISHLAACLLASRLGMRDIPEESTSTAIQKMTDVVKGLETLRATQAQGG